MPNRTGTETLPSSGARRGTSLPDGPQRGFLRRFVPDGSFRRRACAAVLVALVCGPSLAQAEFRAGAAVRLVNPDPLLPVTGGTGGSTPVTNRVGDLTVRALVLEQGATRVALVSADFLGFPRQLGDRVRGRVRGVPGTNILIGATHTHSAPDPYGFPGPDGRTGADTNYLDRVCVQMADAIEAACAGLQPAALKIGTGEAKGKIAYNYYAPDLYDPRCHVIQAVGADGRAIATLVNYAIHPEVLGSDRGLLSPDLVGPLCDRVQRGGAGIGLFLNSAQGGMVTADVRRADGGENNTWEECVRIGERLAEEALRIVGEAPLQRDPALRCLSREIHLPVESELMRGLMSVLAVGQPLLDPEGLRTQLNLVRVGDAEILTIPGEALPNIGYYLKRKMGGRHNLLFGLTNDAFGYLLTEVDWGSFKRYDYISRTSLGEHAGPIYIAEALRLIQDAK